MKRCGFCNKSYEDSILTAKSLNIASVLLFTDSTDENNNSGEHALESIYTSEVYSYGSAVYCSASCFIDGLALIGVRNPATKLVKKIKAITIQARSGLRMVAFSQMDAPKFKKRFTTADRELANVILTHPHFRQPQYASFPQESPKKGSLKIYSAKGEVTWNIDFWYRTNPSIRDGETGFSILISQRMFLIDPKQKGISRNLFTEAGQEFGAKFSLKNVSTFDLTKNFDKLLFKLKVETRPRDVHDSTVSYFTTASAPDRNKQFIAIEFKQQRNDWILTKIFTFLYLKDLTADTITGLTPRILVTLLPPSPPPFRRVSPPSPTLPPPTLPPPPPPPILSLPTRRPRTTQLIEGKACTPIVFHSWSIPGIGANKNTTAVTNENKAISRFLTKSNIEKIYQCNHLMTYISSCGFINAHTESENKFSRGTNAIFALNSRYQYSLKLRLFNYTPQIHDTNKVEGTVISQQEYTQNYSTPEIPLCQSQLSVSGEVLSAVSGTTKNLSQLTGMTLYVVQNKNNLTHSHSGFIHSSLFDHWGHPYVVNVSIRRRISAKNKVRSLEFYFQPAKYKAEIEDEVHTAGSSVIHRPTSVSSSFCYEPIESLNVISGKSPIETSKTSSSNKPTGRPNPSMIIPEFTMSSVGNNIPADASTTTGNGEKKRVYELTSIHLFI